MKYLNTFATLALTLLAAHAAPSYAADDAGRVMFVAGKAMIIDATGQERVARKGAVLKQGDRLVTSDKGMIQVKMRDDGVMAIRPNTDLKLNNLLPQASKSDGPSQALLLNKGGVRVLTGNANNKLGYLIKTAATSLKLREGDTEALVIPPLTPAAGNGKVDTIPAGTYNRVNAGTGTFQLAAGSALTLTPNQISYTTSVNPTPVLVASLPSNYINTTVPLQINNTTNLATTAPPPTLVAPSTLTTLAPINTTPTTLIASTTLAPVTSLTTAPTTLATAPLTTTLITTAPVTMVAPLPPPPVVAPPPVYINPILVIQPIVTQPILQPVTKICTIGKTC